MQSKKLPLVVIVGPTASGKSALAIRLAKKFNGEIISADSRQVYRGLDIGTAKITHRGMRGVPHHLIDIAEPRRSFSVAEFKTKAAKAIRDIIRCGRLPIVVGGTGFWIEALLRNIPLPAVPPNPKLRKHLERKSSAALYALLKRHDSKRARAVGRHNKRRLIRALEIIQRTGRPIPPLRRQSPYQTIILALNPPRPILERRLRERLAAMLRRGLLQEVRKLRQRGLSRKRLQELGFEYAIPAQYLRGEIDRATMEQKLFRSLRSLVRRQYQWFRRWPEAKYIQKASEAERAARQFLRK